MLTISIVFLSLLPITSQPNQYQNQNQDNFFDNLIQDSIIETLLETKAKAIATNRLQDATLDYETELQPKSNTLLDIKLLPYRVKKAANTPKIPPPPPPPTPKTTTATTTGTTTPQTDTFASQCKTHNRKTKQTKEICIEFHYQGSKFAKGVCTDMGSDGKFWCGTSSGWDYCSECTDHDQSSQTGANKKENENELENAIAEIKKKHSFDKQYNIQNFTEAKFLGYQLQTEAQSASKQQYLPLTSDVLIAVNDIPVSSVGLDELLSNPALFFYDQESSQYEDGVVFPIVSNIDDDNVHKFDNGRKYADGVGDNIEGENDGTLGVTGFIKIQYFGPQDGMKFKWRPVDQDRRYEMAEKGIRKAEEEERVRRDMQKRDEEINRDLLLKAEKEKLQIEALKKQLEMEAAERERIKAAELVERERDQVLHAKQQERVAAERREREVLEQQREQHEHQQQQEAQQEAQQQQQQNVSPPPPPTPTPSPPPPLPPDELDDDDNSSSSSPSSASSSASSNPMTPEQKKEYKRKKKEREQKKKEREKEKKRKEREQTKQEADALNLANNVFGVRQTEEQSSIIARGRASNSNFQYTISFDDEDTPLGLVFGKAQPSLLEDVIPNSEADVANIKTNDKLVDVCGSPVTDDMGISQISKLIFDCSYPRNLKFKIPRVEFIKKVEQVGISGKAGGKFVLEISSPLLFAGRYVVPSVNWGGDADCDPSLPDSKIILMPNQDPLACDYDLLNAEENSLLGEDGAQSTIVLASRGLCPMLNKPVHANHAGAKGVIIVNTEGFKIQESIPTGGADTSTVTSPVASLAQLPIGHALVQMAKSPSPLSGKITCFNKHLDEILHEDHEDYSDFEDDLYPELESSNENARGVMYSSKTGDKAFDVTWANFGYFPEKFPYSFLPATLAQKEVANVPYSTHNGVATVVPAKPPHGCDKDQYVSKISGAVVAIMRGGGCSFGEKITLAKELGARGVIIVDDDDSDSPSRLQRLMVDDDQEDELGDVFPVVMTIKGFWAENFDVKEGVARNTVYVRVVSGEILIKGIEKMRKEMAWRAAGEN